MPAFAERHDFRRRAGGGALALALLVLTALTVLVVVAAHRGADVQAIERRDAELRARNAAEQGIASALAGQRPPARTGAGTGPIASAASAPARYRYRVRYAGRSPELVPDGYSIGSDAGFAALHFEVRAVGTAGGQEVAVEQRYYVVGPADE